MRIIKSQLRRWEISLACTDEESLRRNHSGIGSFLHEARDVFHMGSDVDDIPVSTRSSSMLRARSTIPKTVDFGRSWTLR